MPRFVVWVSELDSRLSRRYGRMVPRSSALRAPREVEVFEALRALGVRIIERHPEKMNPRLAGLDEELRVRGLFLVESDKGKGKTLRAVAQKVHDVRSKVKTSRGRKGRKKKRRR
ncbi:MAG: signal recognition particle protein Srp19 [Thermococci archaeon]|nr:signal recognition particle protein Srp19 [Thermococci archaeon]